MKKFQYKLEPLLKIRKFQEKLEFSHYAKILGEINRNRQTISEALESKEQFMNEERGKMFQGEFNLRDKQMALDFYKKLTIVKVNAEKKIESMKDESEKLRKKAELARRNRRILEILKEKKYSEFQIEQNKIMYKELDEFNQRKKEGHL